MTWFDRIGIDRRVRLVAMCRGMVTMTRNGDIYHLWIFDNMIASGTALTIRAMYAEYLAPDDFLRNYYVDIGQKPT